MTRSDTGRQSEEFAARVLEEAGYRIRERNFRTPAGEVDIVAEDGPVLCFVEVKSRASDAYGLPEEAVTASKRSRIRRAAETYLARAVPKDPPACRFDVVAVDLDAAGRPLRHRLYKDAFT